MNAWGTIVVMPTWCVRIHQAHFSVIVKKVFLRRMVHAKVKYTHFVRFVNHFHKIVHVLLISTIFLKEVNISSVKESVKVVNFS